MIVISFLFHQNRLDSLVMLSLAERIVQFSYHFPIMLIIERIQIRGKRR